MPTTVSLLSRAEPMVVLSAFYQNVCLALFHIAQFWRLGNREVCRFLTSVPTSQALWNARPNVCTSIRGKEKKAFFFGDDSSWLGFGHGSTRDL